jgi:hypothetical protein
MMRRNDGWVGGAVLIAIGVALLLGQVTDDVGQFILLGLGLVLLILFAVSRNPGALIGGGILTGLGAGVATAAYLSSETTASSELVGSAVLFGLGGGFLFVWLVGELFRVPEARFWPLIPGTILALVGVIVLAGSDAAEATRFIWPVALIALGLIAVVGAFRRRPPSDQPGPTGGPGPMDQPGPTDQGPTGQGPTEPPVA